MSFCKSFFLPLKLQCIRCCFSYSNVLKTEHHSCPISVKIDGTNIALITNFFKLHVIHYRSFSNVFYYCRRHLFNPVIVEGSQSHVSGGLQFTNPDLAIHTDSINVVDTFDRRISDRSRNLSLIHI